MALPPIGALGSYIKDGSETYEWKEGVALIPPADDELATYADDANDYKVIVLLAAIAGLKPEVGVTLVRKSKEAFDTFRELDQAVKRTREILSKSGVSPEEIEEETKGLKSAPTLEEDIVPKLGSIASGNSAAASGNSAAAVTKVESFDIETGDSGPVGLKPRIERHTAEYSSITDVTPDGLGKRLFELLKDNSSFERVLDVSEKVKTEINNLIDNPKTNIEYYDKETEKTPIFYTTGYKDPTFLKKLLDRDADIYKIFRTYYTIMEFLTENEASSLIFIEKMINDIMKGKQKPIDVCGKRKEYKLLMNARDHFFYKDLHKAILFQSEKIIALLILAGAIFYDHYLPALISKRKKLVCLAVIPWLKKRLLPAFTATCRDSRVCSGNAMDVACGILTRDKDIQMALIAAGVPEPASCSLQGGRRRKLRLRRSKKAKSRAKAKRSTKRR